jgi:predicted nucleic acid-binding protein
VPDTNVVASALLWNGNPRRLARTGVVSLFTSPDLIDELTDILSRRKFEKRSPVHLLSVDPLVDLYANSFPW